MFEPIYVSTCLYILMLVLPSLIYDAIYVSYHGMSSENRLIRFSSASFPEWERWLNPACRFQGL